MGEIKHCLKVPLHPLPYPLHLLPNDPEIVFFAHPTLQQKMIHLQKHYYLRRHILAKSPLDLQYTSDFGPLDL